MSSRCSLVFVVILVWSAAAARGGELDTPEHTTPDSTDSSTEIEVTENLENPEKDKLDKARIVDYGGYTPQQFEYQNAQKDGVLVVGGYNDACIQSYIDCVGNQVVPESVCAYNAFDYGGSDMWHAPSACDVQLDNCRRGYRVWKVVFMGPCRYTTAAPVYVAPTLWQRFTSWFWNLFG